MRIVISYHHFVRDYRGSRLLADVLKSLGHWVLVTPAWNSDDKLIETFRPDVVVGCQVAEKTTSRLADVTQKAGVHLVINSSEQFTTPANHSVFVSYNCDQLNEPYIAFQVIACPQLEKFIQNHPGIQDKSKYRSLGFPRYDIAIDPQLRSVETPLIRSRYGLPAQSKHALYISSFLFEETFQGLPEEDMKRFSYQEVANRNRRISEHVFPTLRAISDKILDRDGVLLIKKHPWDFSNVIDKEFADHPRIRVLNRDEYIVPCLDACEYILHSFSTAAIEAWVMDKKTVAILPQEFRQSLELSHMSLEVKTEGRDDTLEVLQNYPPVRSPAQIEQLLNGRSDGRSTIRLAAEIQRLQPPRQKQFSRLALREYLRNIRRFRDNLNGRGFLGPGSESPKMTMLHEFETTRRKIDAIYRKPFANYVKQHQSYLHELID